jgi:prepilin-type processing-associated H-X9-DG protein
MYDMSDGAIPGPVPAGTDYMAVPFNTGYPPVVWWIHTDDDGVSRVPTSYPRLKEGIERFFITDINNPAAAAKAASTLPCMMDAWGAPTDWGGAVFGPQQENMVAIFNHVPGGSNVLYLDGHVEFLRYGSKFPVSNAKTLCAGRGLHNFVGALGGQG